MSVCRDGHDWVVVVLGGLPVGVSCRGCGWFGDVTMSPPDKSG